MSRRPGVRIDLDTGNAAFDDDAGAEVARILRDLADRLERDGIGGPLPKPADLNGNTVGAVTLRPRR